MWRAIASGAVVVGAVVALGTAGGGQGRGISRTELGRGTAGTAYEADGVEGSEIVVQSVFIEPGADSGWHTHPGSEIAIVKSGTLTFLDGDDPQCAPKTYEPGDVVVGSGHVHQGKNLGDRRVELVVTYFGVPAGEAAATPVGRPGQCPAGPGAESPTGPPAESPTEPPADAPAG